MISPSHELAHHADLAMALSNGIQVHGCGERGDSLDAVGLAGGGRIAPAVLKTHKIGWVTWF